jgi:diaminohydroxyphosphoribosylaminopyrimidine deaminase/5-amino-6-(5-phosphoribosylamino)uracil reductase
LLDEDYMKQALKLARKGLGKTNPNPMVGAVIVKDDRIIARGYHQRYGGNHAEVNAFRTPAKARTGRLSTLLWSPAPIMVKRLPASMP